MMLCMVTGDAHLPRNKKLRRSVDEEIQASVARGVSHAAGLVHGRLLCTLLARVLMAGKRQLVEIHLQQFFLVFFLLVYDVWSKASCSSSQLLGPRRTRHSGRSRWGGSIRAFERLSDGARKWDLNVRSLSIMNIHYWSANEVMKTLIATSAA